MLYIITLIILILILSYALFYIYITNSFLKYQILFINKSISKKTSKTSDLSEFCIEKILTKNQSEYFANKIKQHEKLWKNKNIIMSTLGTASYLEGSKGFEYYQIEYLKTNEFLFQHFNELYDILLQYLKKRCPESNIQFIFALPGFHIFKCNSLFNLPIASVHKDLQYLNIKFDKKVDIDYNKTCSFTLCLELPTSGGGLYIFENEQIKVDYKPGYIICHNGKTDHMIAPSQVHNSSNEQSFRITLQGHGLYDKISNTWFVYW